MKCKLCDNETNDTSGICWEHPKEMGGAIILAKEETKTPQQVLQEAREEFEIMERNHGWIPEHKEQILSWHDRTLQVFIDAEIKRLKKTKVAGGNYNCGEEGCCPKPKKGSLEENDFEWQIGYNQALQDQISHLKELLSIK